MRLFLKIAGFGFLAVVVCLVGFRAAAAWREIEPRDLSAPPEGRMIETSQGEVYVEEYGPNGGRPVLLVHGSVGWSRFWFETTDALAEAGYRAIAFDLSPMGFSERDKDGDYSRGKQAARILALTDAMRISPVLVAHSFGAGPATEAVMLSQDSFDAFVIVDGAIGVGSHEAEKTLPLPLRSPALREVGVSLTVTNPWALKPLLRLFLHRKEAATQEYLDVLSVPFTVAGTTPAIADWLPTLLVPPTDALSTRRDSYATLSLPVGIIWGAEDTATPLTQGEELNALIPSSKLKVLDDVGHIPQIEDPALFQEALLDLLQGF